MIPVLFSIIVVSFSGVMLPGPMFAAALAKGYYSPWIGARMAVGHAAVEIPIVLLIYYGFSRFFENEIVRLSLSLAGGLMILWLGVSLFRMRRSIVQKDKGLPYNAFIAGIILSVLNPFFILWWVTVGSALLMKFLDYSPQGLPLFIAVHWLCDLVWLSAIAIVAFKTRSLWSAHIQEGVFIACSLVLVGFGSWFIISGLQLVV
jgi:threonine/homoserine/homoserine lactone efflux protein